MRKSEPVLALLLTVFLALLWLGFLFHHDERFAGTLLGGVFAITGTIFLLVPLIYSIIKRVPRWKAAFSRKMSFATFLTIHIYSGFIGAILVLFHTGHKFNGILATTLTGLLLVVVFSGYIGRYILSWISTETIEKKRLLSNLQDEYGKKVVALHSHSEEKEIMRPFSRFFLRLFAPKTVGVFALAESIADTEFAISTEDLFKRLFSTWLKVHIVLSLTFYVLLTLHVVGVYNYGLRWFQ